MNNPSVNKIRQNSKNLIISSIIDMNNKILKITHNCRKFLRKTNTQSRNQKHFQVNMLIKDYSKEPLEINKKTHTYDSSIMNLITLSQNSNSNNIPSSTKQYIEILKKLRQYYSLPQRINVHMTYIRKLQLLNVLLKQNLISYPNPTSPINHKLVISTYEYIRPTIRQNSYVNHDQFLKRLRQTIKYNTNYLKY